jgi:drug/metabolite transporter (DMT)-like permease
MGLLYLFIVVLAITAVALIAKIASRKQITAFDLSVSLFGVSTLLGALILSQHLPVTITGAGLVISAVAGVGGAFAVLLFNLAVREGHFGFSNAIYRSSFLIPVVFAAFFLNQPLKWTTLLGIGLISTAIFLMSWSADSFARGKKAEFRWFLLIIAAFALSGAPRVGQTLTSHYKIDSYLYLFLSYAFGAAIFLFDRLKMRSFNLAALTWGSGAAVASYIGVFCTLKALDTLKPQIFFPISLSGPIILGILSSYFVFREKIRPAGWLGILMGIIGIAVLYIWK